MAYRDKGLDCGGEGVKFVGDENDPALDKDGCKDGKDGIGVHVGKERIEVDVIEEGVTVVGPRETESSGS